MKYNQVVPGIFLQRPNRFIAHVLISGKEEVCHVKNTGRCRELLIPGCTVYCSVSGNPQRKTKFDLIAVEKIIESQTVFANTGTTSQNVKSTPETHNTFLVNMDSQAPNAAVKEWLQSGASPFQKIDFLKPEYKYGNSRFDFYLECNNRKIFLEVKGVTLEDATKVSINSVEVPVNIQWGPDLLIARPFIFASPFLGVNLGTKFSKETTLADTINKNLHRLEYGLGIGVGVNVWKLQVTGKYNWNFGKITTWSDAQANVKGLDPAARTFELGVGLVF